MTHDESTEPLVVTQSLSASYEAADYEVLGRGAPVVLRIGTKAPCLAADDTRPWRRVAIITAWNPFSAPLSDEVNAARQAQLVREVERAGRSWLPALGRDPGGAWAPEPSLAVFDASDDELDEWMLAFGQNAVVVAAAAGSCELRFHPHERTRVEVEGPVAARAAARLWARAWNTGELDLIEGALREDVVFTSQREGVVLEGRAAVSAHLRHALGARDARMGALVAMTAELPLGRPYVVQSEGGATPAAVVLFTLRRGSIARVDECRPERP